MFENYKFRSSSLSLIMGNSRSKTDPLSETCKSYLNEIYIKEKYGREKIIVSKYMSKGNEKEDESISLYRKLTQSFFIKNEKNYSNDYITGTPDIILEDKVIDIKTCWDIFSFFTKKENTDQKKNDYFDQLTAYMWLTGVKQSEVVYTLISNDESIIYSELNKIKCELKLDDHRDEKKIERIEKQLRINNSYEDINLDERVKIYKFTYDEEYVEKIKSKIILCREYLQNLEKFGLSQAQKK